MLGSQLLPNSWRVLWAHVAWPSFSPLPLLPSGTPVTLDVSAIRSINMQMGENFYRARARSMKNVTWIVSRTLKIPTRVTWLSHTLSLLPGLPSSALASSQLTPAHLSPAPTSSWQLSQRAQQLPLLKHPGPPPSLRPSPWGHPLPPDGEPLGRRGWTWPKLLL